MSLEIQASAEINRRTETNKFHLCKNKGFDLYLQVSSSYVDIIKIHFEYTKEQD